MAEKKFSCIKKVVKTVQIPLPATFISNEVSGIAEVLDSWKRQYLKQLQGVVVNYRNYSLSSSTGFITPSRPFVYYNVKATFDLFCPKVGDIVKGKINRISKEHIGCLIEDTINVTIHLSKDSPNELAPYICLNREILLEILSFNFDRKMIRVTGRVTHKCMKLMRDSFPPPTFSNLVDAPELSNNTDEGIGTSSESTDEGLLNHTFDGSKTHDEDVTFKKPLSSITKSKKKSSKMPKSDSESSSIDTSDVSTSDEKPKKKKKKHTDKSNPDVGNHLSSNSQSLDMVSSDALIQDFRSLNHSEILDAIKEEESLIENDTHVKKHKKKKKRDLSPSLIGESLKSNNYSLVKNTSAVIEAVKPSKKRKRESESSCVDASEQSTADEMPKKKKKRKDKTVAHEEKEIKNELSDTPDLAHEEKEIKNEFSDTPDQETFTATLLSLKTENSSPVKVPSNSVPKSKKKNKDKKSKEKSKKKKGKTIASGAVLKKDKKLHKKDSKKNKLEGKQSKKHKKGKSKKKKDNSKSKVSDVIKSEKE